MKNKKYKVFGLNIISRNLDVPELKYTKSSKCDVEVLRESNKNWTQNTLFDKKYKNLLINKNELILHVKGIADFKVSYGNKILWHNLKKTYLEDEIRTYILGSAIGAILIQRGHLVLHANALTKGGKTIVCAGDPGGGKSTLAYSLMKRGWSLLSDDLVALSNKFFVLPGIPRIKLWEDAISYFGVDKNEITRIRKDMNKYQLSGNSVKSILIKKKLSTIYILDGHQKAEGIKKIIGDKCKLINLMSYIYRPLYVREFNKRKNYFKNMSEIIKKVPIYKLSLPNTLSKLEYWLDRNEFDL